MRKTSRRSIPQETEKDVVLSGINSGTLAVDRMGKTSGLLLIVIFAKGELTGLVGVGGVRGGPPT